MIDLHCSPDKVTYKKTLRFRKKHVTGAVIIREKNKMELTSTLNEAESNLEDAPILQK